VLKSSKTAVKLKNDFENSDSDDFENNNQKNFREQDQNEMAEIKPKLERSLSSKTHLIPSFKNVGFKIILGKRAIRRFDESSTMVLQELEKNLMSEYFEIDDKVYDNSYMRLFSKYVKDF